MTSRYEPWDETRGAEIIAGLSHVEGGTLVILHALQEEFGCIDAAASCGIDCINSRFIHHASAAPAASSASATAAGPPTLRSSVLVRFIYRSCAQA